MAHIKFVFPVERVGQSDEIIALLQDFPFSGFHEEEAELTAYMEERLFEQDLYEKLFYEKSIKYCISVVEDKNWNEVWESDFEPVGVFREGESSLFAWIRASFHQPHPDARFDLLITPKMSFGTGHHATTFQMMELMSGLDFQGKQVIDFGTGTGLLAILAEKMGASNILAIDNDDWSINNTLENIAANQCHNIDIVKAEECISAPSPASIVLANINLNVILDNLSKIVNSAAPEAIILFSGILSQDLDIISPAIEKSGLQIQKIASRNNWLIIEAKKY